MVKTKILLDRTGKALEIALRLQEDLDDSDSWNIGGVWLTGRD